MQNYWCIFEEIKMFVKEFDYNQIMLYTRTALPAVLFLKPCIYHSYATSRAKYIKPNTYSFVFYIENIWMLR